MTKQNSGTMFADHEYHLKQKDYIKSAKEEINDIYKSSLGMITKKTEDMVNSMESETKDLYYSLRENKAQYTQNYGKFCNGIGVDKYAVDRDPLLSKFQKTFESQMLQNAIDKNGSGFLKNSYGGYGGSAHFMIRALSYIYPLLIIQPLPKLTWREDWPILDSSGWAQFDVFLSAQRVYNASAVNDEANDSGRVQATFGENIYQNITIRQDIVWDSTPEFYADQSMNNGLVSWVYFEAMKRGFDEKVNDIYLLGDSASGILGLLNNPSIASVTSGGSWRQINGVSQERNSTTDLINLTQAVEQNSNGVFEAKKIMMSLSLKPLVILPRSQYVSTSPIGYVAGQAWGGDYSKVLETARYNPYLNDKGTGGNTQIAFAYDVDASFAHIGVPQFMFAEPISWEGHKYKMPFLTRSGGLRVVQAPSIVKIPSILTS
jgi:hypothetical protein